MSKRTYLRSLPPHRLYRWAFLALPVLAVVLSACGTGGNSGGLGY
jgi:hypothetical protein